jgi:hypothetical protein
VEEEENKADLPVTSAWRGAVCNGDAMVKRREAVRFSSVRLLTEKGERVEACIWWRRRGREKRGGC